MKRILSAMTLLLVAAGLVSAQNGYLVKGVVVDAQGPVIGATVLQQGTQNGTVTGLDGDYTLRVPDADALVEISCIGYATQVFKASEVPAQVVLVEDTEFLDEVVVIGYGTLSKKEVSASIVQVDSKDFFRGTTNNPMTMLTGKVAGLIQDTKQLCTTMSAEILPNTQFTEVTLKSKSNSSHVLYTVVVESLPRLKIGRLATY